MGGYHIQQVPGDGNPLTSDAIYVFNSSFAVSAGDKVRVTGTIVEFDQSGALPGTLTELTSVTSAIPCSMGHSVTPTGVQLPIANVADWENYEGMLVELTGGSGPLVLTEMFALGQFGEIVVASERMFQPTNIVEPGAPALAQQALNDRSKLLISDGRNGTPPVGTVPHVPSAATMFRMGDTTTSVIGVINYTEFSGVAMHRLEYTVAPTWTNVNVRPASTPLAGSGRLRVASFNVLNFFNGDGLGGGFPTTRGADTLSEYNRQRDKLVVALGGLDADIIGLMEIENDSGPNSAVAQLTAALNAYLGVPGEYAYINTGVVGTDEIRVAILYRPSAVTPSGTFAVLDDVAPFNVNTRPPVLQTFTETLTGKDISVVVNHFKSKGSCPGSGADTDQGDGQSCWNATRVLAAQELLAWLPTATADTDILIIGDLNAYANEDPIDTIIAGGYTNLISAYHGTSAYGYVFGGQSGYLDHALASASLLGQITGADDWHINSDEATLRDYNDYANQAIYYEVNQFRTSDHDPVVIGVDLSGADGSISSTPTVAAGQSVTVTVTDADLQGASISVSATSTEGEAEILTLNATANPGEYSGSFTIANTAPTAANLALEGQSGTMTFTYIDALTADGSLNINRTDTTTVAVPGATGTITSTPAVFAGQNVTVTVNDLDLSALTITVGVVGSNGDSETLILNPTATPGEYSGSFVVANDNSPVVGNGTIEEFGGTLTFTYVDALDVFANVNSARTDETTVNPLGATASITSTETIPSGAQVTVTVVDADIVGPSLTVLATATGESASLQLDATANPGEYTGTFTVLNAPPTPANGLLELESGILTFTYVDHLDDEGDVDSDRTDTTIVIASGNTGAVQATESIIPGADSYVISVSDSDLDAATVNVTVTSSAGESEIVALDMTAPGEYSRTFDTLDQNPTSSSGEIEVRDGETLTVTYVDALDLEGDVNTSLADTTTVIATNVPGGFTLTSPADGDILRDGTPMLEWTQAADDNTYQVLLVQLSGNSRLGILIEAVVEADDVCVAGVCSVDPTTYVPDLAVGTYSWTVEATGTSVVEASNAPSVFTVVLDGIELVSNGGFENALTGWTKVAPAKVKCGAFGAGSDCALQLKPGGSVKQKDVMAAVLAHVDSAAGDVLRISALIWSPRSNLARAVIVKVVYVTPTAGVNANGRDKIKLSPAGVTTVYAEYAVQFELDDAIVSGSVKVSNSALSGKIVVDDVSVQLMPIGTVPRSTETSGALPLPSVPGNFRGGN
ncbi:MAG: ExeM/NucH family extracellular endonuclease [Chloroflexi bacterium]|nr:ExeM/NucH family extracellular endonuclease [Chloroflexota bacterium]